jgi:hypothetical protein
MISGLLLSSSLLEVMPAMNAARTYFEQIPLEVVKEIIKQNPAELAVVPDSDMPYPSWQLPLREAFLEDGLEKAQEKIHRAEAAIFLRSQQLAESSDGHREREAIARGTQSLLKLLTEKLKWPFPTIERS